MGAQHKQQDHTEQKHDMVPQHPPTPSVVPQETPNIPIPPTPTQSQPAPPEVQPVPSVTVNGPIESGGGAGNSNGQIWCSGPSAPGWDVNLVGGGCNPKVEKMSATSTVAPTEVRLSQLPYTSGDEGIQAEALFILGICIAMVFSIIAGYYSAKALQYA